MTARDVRTLVIEAWQNRLQRAAVAEAYTLARELAVIAEGHGVKLARPAHLHDPVAEDWRQGLRPAGRPPGEAYQAAREQLLAGEQEGQDDEHESPAAGQLDLLDLIEGGTP